jgi:hypothetical protein
MRLGMPLIFIFSRVACESAHKNGRGTLPLKKSLQTPCSTSKFRQRALLPSSLNESTIQYLLHNNTRPDVWLLLASNEFDLTFVFCLMELVMLAKIIYGELRIWDTHVTIRHFLACGLRLDLRGTSEVPSFMHCILNRPVPFQIQSSVRLQRP